MSTRPDKPLFDPGSSDLPDLDSPSQERESARITLGEIAVSSELAALFQDARGLLDAVKHDPEVPANQRAQVLNSVLSILERITKTRTDLYNSERIRNIEQTLLRVMKEQPQEVREAFFATYEAALAE